MREPIVTLHAAIEAVLGLVVLYNLIAGAFHRHTISPKVEQALSKADIALKTIQSQSAAQQFVAPLLAELHDIKERMPSKGNETP